MQLANKHEEYFMKLKPTADRILVRRKNISVVSKGGIILPDINKKSRARCFEGTVLGVGDGCRFNGKRIRGDVEVGDSVLFGKFVGVELNKEGDDLMILHGHDILAKVSN